MQPDEVRERARVAFGGGGDASLAAGPEGTDAESADHLPAPPPAKREAGAEEAEAESDAEAGKDKPAGGAAESSNPHEKLHDGYYMRPYIGRPKAGADADDKPNLSNVVSDGRGRYVLPPWVFNTEGQRPAADPKAAQPEKAEA
ncbi:hypothetical protein CDD83_4351 [Cordyceps sp. RAO-2017]|nr:hypothetical protein CDD83_4351 [Cordyceps sp. RAO-2017]